MKSAISFSKLKEGVNKICFMNVKQLQPTKTSTKSSLSECLFLGGLLVGGYLYGNKDRKMHSWIYRDDIGAPHGIHGYEEVVNSVGQHHGHFHWAQEGFLSTFDSAS
jgi:hypothetical protein